MSYETSPDETPDDASFLPVIPPFTLAVGTRVDVAPFATAHTPIGRWVRWKITAAGTWTATLRIWVLLYGYG